MARQPFGAAKHLELPSPVTLTLLGFGMSAFLAACSDVSSDAASSGGAGGLGGLGGTGGTGGAVDPPACDLGASTDEPVTGTLIDTHCTDADPVFAPRVGTKLTAVITDSAGTLCSVTATVDASGAFTLPKIPARPFILRGASEKQLVTSERVLELGTYKSGRPGLRPITIAPTWLNFRVTGLAPLAAHDFVLFSIGAPFFGGIDAFAEGIPMAGDTFLENARVDVSGLSYGQLIDGNAGDRLYFTQRLLSVQQGAFSGTAVAVLEIADLVLADGQVTDVVGTARTLEVEPTLREWDGAAFERAALDRGPGTAMPKLGLLSVVHPAGDGLDCTFPTTSTAVAQFPPHETGTLELGVSRPYRASWPTQLLFAISYNSGEEVMGMIPFDATSSEPIRPLVSPPRDVRLGGLDTKVPVSGVGTTPLLEFSLPATGVPDAYVIDVFGADAEIVTADTSFTLPPGLLREGESYSLEVSARLGGSASTPYQWYRRTGHGQASTRTEIITP